MALFELSITFTALCTLAMITLLSHLLHRFYCSKIQLIAARPQRIISVLCILLCIACSCTDLFKIAAWRGQTADVPFGNAITDLLYYTSCIFLYIRLIYFQLHLPFKNSAYAYSKSSICMASTPVFIIIPSMLLYIYGMFKYKYSTEDQDLFIAPYFVIFFISDTLLNLSTLYLITSKLKQMILDTPYEGLQEINEAPDSISKMNNARISTIWHKTADNSHFDVYIALIARYYTLTLIAMSVNQIYFIAMAMWILE